MVADAVTTTESKAANSNAAWIAAREIEQGILREGFARVMQYEDSVRVVQRLVVISVHPFFEDRCYTT